MATPPTMRADKNGKPFKSEDEALKAIIEFGLSGKEYGAVKHQGGWFLETFADTVKRNKEALMREEELARIKAGKDTYRKVKFLGAQNPENDTERVELMCNGKCLVIERDTEVVVPQRFLNVADEAAYEVVKPLRNPDIGETPFVISGVVKRYPYTDLGEATEVEYLAMVQAGNKAQKEEFERLRQEKDKR